MRANAPANGADRKGGLDVSPRWGKSGKSDPLTRYLSDHMRLAPKTIEHRIDELPKECEDVILGFHAIHDQVRLERFMRRIFKAHAQREAPPLVPATFNLANEADHAEDVDELRFVQDDSDANLDRLIRAKERAAARELPLLDALYEERERRRYAKAGA